VGARRSSPAARRASGGRRRSRRRGRREPQASGVPTPSSGLPSPPAFLRGHPSSGDPRDVRIRLTHPPRRLKRCKRTSWQRLLVETRQATAKCYRRRGAMADGSLLPRRIVKETQRLLTEPGAPRQPAGGLQAVDRSRAAAALTHPCLYALCSCLPLRQPLESLRHHSWTTCAISTFSSKGQNSPHTRVRTTPPAPAPLSLCSLLHVARLLAP
jgi:hypothetical protein